MKIQLRRQPAGGSSFVKCAEVDAYAKPTTGLSKPGRGGEGALCVEIGHFLGIKMKQ